MKGLWRKELKGQGNEEKRRKRWRRGSGCGEEGERKKGAACDLNLKIL